jgi:DNA modification methylase
VNFTKGSTAKARKLTNAWIRDNLAEHKGSIELGLPEYDDRLELWRVSLISKTDHCSQLGEVKINQLLDAVVDHTKTTLILQRLKTSDKHGNASHKGTRTKQLFYPAAIPNKIICGDSIKVLDEFPADTAQLVITSPPYYNARPEYSEYLDYQEYLDFLRKVFARCHRVLSEGRFCIVNISPVLVKRISRNASSKRVPIPFDLHKILDNIGFDFIDDIFWVKPEGAGWNLGRGRRFRADRQPLQYKPVPVTEYVLVYRKRTDKLIDWNLRNHHDQTLVDKARILGDYDITNIWHIQPNTTSKHPAPFPDDLVRRLIRYYSFIDDLVLDPFAGSGTVGKIALEMQRRFIVIDKEPEYYELMKDVILKHGSPDTRIDSEMLIDDEE